MRAREEEIVIDVDESAGRISAVAIRPPNARLFYLFAHGAGAGMRHAFMQAIALRLADRGVATLRFQFPYVEAGRKRPDRPAVLLGAVRAAALRARALAGDAPIIAGGKSMGGRMSSQAQAEEALPGVSGLAFFGFPLHAPGKPKTERAAHLEAVEIPMLFLQGTRDSLADLDLMREVCGKLGDRATLHVSEGADHSFKVLKRSGRDPEEVRDELADVFVRWARRL